MGSHKPGKVGDVLHRHASVVLFAFVLAGCAADPSVDSFDVAILHKVDITVVAAHLDELETDMETRVPCTIVYDGEQVEQAGIRQKGNQLVELDDKPSFSVKFDEFVDGRDLHGYNKVLLDNSLQDPTLLRSRLGSDTHLRVGIPAARVAHAQVSLNGVDKGIYVVVEAIDKDFLRLHFGEEYDEGNLYEGPCCGDFVDDIERLDLDDEKKDGRSRDDLRALAEIILKAPDATFAANVATKLDLDWFIKSYALEALLGHWDGFAFGANNYYLYNNPRDGRLVFMPHGMDRILEDSAFDAEKTPLTKLPLRIRTIPQLDERFHAELAALAGSAWNETSMQSAVNQVSDVIATAHSGGQTDNDLEHFNASVDSLRNTLSARSANISPTP